MRCRAAVVAGALAAVTVTVPLGISASGTGATAADGSPTMITSS